MWQINRARIAAMGGASGDSSTSPFMPLLVAAPKTLPRFVPPAFVPRVPETRVFIPTNDGGLKMLNDNRTAESDIAPSSRTTPSITPLRAEAPLSAEKIDYKKYWPWLLIAVLVLLALWAASRKRAA